MLKLSIHNICWNSISLTVTRHSRKSRGVMVNFSDMKVTGVCWIVHLLIADFPYVTSLLAAGFNSLLMDSWHLHSSTILSALRTLFFLLPSPPTTKASAEERAPTPRKVTIMHVNVCKHYISTWSYENRVSKHFVIFFNFPCLIAWILRCFLMCFFFACFVVRDLCRSGCRQNYYLTPPPASIFSYPQFFL